MLTSLMDKVLNKINQKEFVYYSAYNVCISQYDKSQSNAYNILHVEYLNSLTLSGVPPHKLTLKKGEVVMSIRNLNHSLGLCNGTRLICKSFTQHLIEAEIITCVHSHEIVFIPRISFIHSDIQLPFEFKCRQFPVRSAFANAINKEQWQTMKFVGIYLPQSVFSHEQLYIALPRVSSSSKI